jgi:CMP-N,N'-diacetyllegionaminic acid synthase
VPLNDSPLIGHTIKVALDVASLVNDVYAIVSTDDEDIKQLSIELGIDAPFLRPEKISDDFSSSIEYVNHAIKFFSSKGSCPENVIILQPTSPLRTTKDVLSAIELFDESEENSLISVYEDHTINGKIMYTLRGRHGVPLNPLHNVGSRRQDDDSVFIRNGAIYITRVEYLRDNDHLVSKSPLLLMMPKSRSINIDTPEDLMMAEKLLS